MEQVIKYHFVLDLLLTIDNETYCYQSLKAVVQKEYKMFSVSSTLE